MNTNLSLSVQDLRYISTALWNYGGTPDELQERIDKELKALLNAQQSVHKEEVLVPPIYNVRKIQILALLRLNNQLDDLPKVDTTDATMPIIAPISSQSEDLWRGLGVAENDEFLVQADYFEHLRWVHGLVEFAEEAARVSRLSR